MACELTSERNRPYPKEECMEEAKTPIEQNAKDILKRYEVNIRFLDSGVIIRVGCKSFAFSDKDEALRQIQDYINMPLETYNFWIDEC